MPDYEAVEALDEIFEADEALDEALDEATRAWSRPRPKVATGRNLYTARPQTQYVTQAQLQTALAKVGSQVRTNSNAISQFGGRLATEAATRKKDSLDRKKDITSVKNNLSQTQQMAAILPMLTQPKHIDVGADLTDAAGDVQIKKGTSLLVNGSNTLSLLLPFLLLGGTGEGSGTGGGLFGGGSDNSSLLMLALVLGMGK